jgi:mannose-6-phosphate isomerase-like protein (cupin superfamily)
MKITKESAEHYLWGQGYDGWHLVRGERLSVIQERMPGGTSEVLHYHEKAQQFFYILSGTATFDLAEKVIEINAGEGCFIEPGKRHRVSNNGTDDLHFLVVSEPMAQGDRVNI